MFINISGSVDGVAWPDHYADIKLKHPERRFKIGQTVKCRVFSIEPEKGRVKLTLKKSLLDAAEPVAQSFDDLKVDMVAAGLITKILDKGVLVELFGGYVVYVPIGEVSEAFITDLKTAVFEGKPVKVKLTTVDRMTEKMFGSIRQALPSAIAATAIEVDDVVSGEVTGIHKDQVGLKLLPSGRKAILALSNLAHHRNVKVTALRTTLKVGEKLDELVVVVKDADSGLIIVANKQNAAKKTEAGAASQSLTMANMKPGQVLPARVTKKNAQGYFLSITRNLIGRLAPTDMADDFGKLPEINQGDIVKCCVVAVNPADRQMDLSIRPSRVDAAASSGKSVIVDREIENLSDLKANQKIRGIVKSIAGSGLYVSLGRTITARVMIKELFDDYVAEWQPRFEVGQVVEGKILKVDEKLKQVELTLRKKPAKAANKKKSIGLADLSVGQKVDTTVRKIEDFGMFLNIEGTRLSGLCHRSELSDEKDANVQQALKTFRQGDKLKAKITAIDTEKGKIALGIKPSYFDAEDFGSKKEDEDIKEEDMAAVDEDVEMPGDDEAEVESDEDDEEDAEVSGEEDSGFLDLEAEDDDEGEEEEEEDGESDLDGEEEDDVESDEEEVRAWT
jgi:rRNA biogenesis protein RRP5